MFNKLRLLTPGPTPIPECVRLALAKDMIHHRKDEFHRIMARVQERLKLLFGTEGPVLPLSCSGTGAMTACVTSLFAPHESVLVIEAGKFGERFVEICRMQQLETHVLSFPWGSAVETEKVENYLNEHPDICGVFLQISETSTGVLHPVQEIARYTRERNILLCLDGISAIGISPCPMDEWGIDCLLTGSQKGLMLPPGLAFIALSERAWTKAEKKGPSTFYFNLPAERKKLEKNETNFTSAVNLIVALDESLAMLLESGLSPIYQKQWALTMLARTGAQALGLELFVKKHYTWGITSVLLPEGIDGTKILKIAQEKYGVAMAGGQDKLKGRIVRIGHMGWVDWADVLAGLYALDCALKEGGGFSASRDYLEQAMAAYEAALHGPIGQEVPKVFVRS